MATLVYSDHRLCHSHSVGGKLKLVLLCFFVVRRHTVSAEGMCSSSQTSETIPLPDPRISASVVVRSGTDVVVRGDRYVVVVSVLLGQG